MEQTIKLKGTYHFEIRDKDGSLVDSWGVNNIVTNAGLAQLASLAGDGGATPFAYIAVGTSNTAPAAGQTALSAEITTGGLARAAGTTSRTTTTVTNDTFQITYTWTASASHTVEEVGVFTASSGGTMLSRALTTTKSIVADQTLTGVYRLKFS